MKKTLEGLIGLCCCGLLGFISSLSFLDVSYADNVSSLPKLQMRIVNTIKNQKFALCLSDTCYVMSTPNKSVLMDGSNIDSIIMTNTGTLQMYTQAIPPSCKITVKDNQTLTVTGKLVAKKSVVELENLKCTIASKTT
jgi:hypothetical protein